MRNSYNPMADTDPTGRRIAQYLTDLTPILHSSFCSLQRLYSLLVVWGCPPADGTPRTLWVCQGESLLSSLLPVKLDLFSEKHRELLNCLGFIL